MKASELNATDVTAFVQRHAYRHSPSHARRLVSAMRSFLQYLRYKGLIDTDLTGADPATEVPPLSLLPFRSQRAQPYLYTEEEIRRLLEAARSLVTPHKLQPLTYYCLFGLLAVSGMRLGEALNLQPHDANWSESLLTIRDAKFGKSRLVPLHSSTLEVLLAYAERRDQIYAPRRVSYFFVSSHGTRCSPPTLAKYSGIYRGRLESAITELVMGRASMTSDTIPSSGLSRVIVCQALFPRNLARNTRHSPRNA